MLSTYLSPRNNLEDEIGGDFSQGEIWNEIEIDHIGRRNEDGGKI